MSELEFLRALRTHLVRHAELPEQVHRHELFQTSTIEALLGGAFDGDMSLTEMLQRGDLGLGTLNGLDGELIILDGQAWKASADCTLVRPPGSSKTPYAVVVPFSPGPAVELPGPMLHPTLGQALGECLESASKPVAVRIDGHFEHVRVRSVPKQRRPYPQLAQALAHQCVADLQDVSGTMVGFAFPDALDGIEMVGWHLHFVTDSRARGGHVLGFGLRHGVAHLDHANELEVELPPAVDVHRQAAVDQDALRRLESDGF